MKDDQLLFIMTIMELLGQPKDPHYIKIAHHNAKQKLEAYNRLPESEKPRLGT
jgi:hypothetical protein